MNNNGTTSSIEFLDDNKVKLTVEVDEKEFDSAVDAAFKRIAKQVRVPGFRPGRVPRRILEVQLGHQYGRAEALREELPSYYQRAVVQHDVDVIDSPDIEILEGQQEGAVVFDATVEIRPVIEVAGYNGLRIEVPSPEPSDEDIDSEIDRLRAEHAEFRTVDRPAQDGDQVNIDIVGSHGGEEMPGLSANDYDYEVGTGAVVAEIDENLRGAEAGDVVVFDADHPDPEAEEPLHFEITVLDVKEAVLPDLDDTWAAQATEFVTLDELRADIGERLASMKLSMARRVADAKIAEALSALVTREIPEVMVADEVNGRLQEVFGNLQQSGIDPSEYLEQTGQDIEQLRAELSRTAENAVKVDLALRAIAEAEGLSPDDDQLAETIDEMAERMGTDGAAHMNRLKELGQLPSLRADLAKSKALEWLLDNVELVDEAGVAVDLKTPESSQDDVGDQDDSAADDSTDGEPQ
ncbi:MAG: trigger factor [Acidimicrobiaceae bacterium]|nr:trigger factor [Acidimicrobiaceae bacterium]MYG54551.1 trigger factor [Acidimicrobiaceae bacterium]MYJ98130.1 trigger factor [Acidimicrobiaceae bacterium]